eukprot:g42008.t1
MRQSIFQEQALELVMLVMEHKYSVQHLNALQQTWFTSNTKTAYAPLGCACPKFKLEIQKAMPLILSGMRKLPVSLGFPYTQGNTTLYGWIYESSPQFGHPNYVKQGVPGIHVFFF